MAIIYSYPTVTPTSDDLVLGTDVNGEGKPTKNFTIQSIVDIVQGGATGLGAVLTISSDALQQPATNFTNVQGTGTSTFGSFTDGAMTISNGVGTGFTAFTSTAITGTLQTAAQPNITSLGNLTGLVINGSVSGTGVITSTTLAGASNTNIASTLAIKTYVDSNPSGAESLAATLLVGNTTGVRDIIVSAGYDITFTDTSKILMGSSVNGDTSIDQNGTKFTISNTKGNIELNNSPAAGSIKLSTAATATNVELDGVAGVDLKFSGNSKLKALTSGVDITGNLDATGSGTFVNLLNSGTYQDSSGDVGTSGQLLSSTGSGTNWVTEVPLYTWTIEADSGTGSPYTVASGDTIDFVGVGNIATEWDNTNKEIKISIAGTSVSGGGAVNQVTYWDGAQTITGAAGFTFAGGATGKVAIGGELEVGGVLTDGTFTGSAGTYTGYTSITSTDFVGALTGNASTATALASSGAIAISGDAVSTGGPHTYTSGGAVTIPTTIANTTVTGKTLDGYSAGTAGAIDANDTILAAFEKLQASITATTGLAYEGTWDARNSAEGGSSNGGNPDLTQAAKKVNGHFYIVSTAGNAEPNGGAGTQLSPWAVGDWCIYVSNGSSTDEWQKLDQSNEVLGSGAANKIAKWTSANTLGTGLISDNGSTVSIGDTGAFEVLGNTTLGNADTDTTLVKGPAHFEETLRADVGIGLGGATYGTAGQVLTSGGGAASVNTWTTPTTGTVTSVGLTETGDALTITGSPVTGSGTINIAGAGASTDYINGELNKVAFPVLDNYQYWTLSDGTNTTNITTTGTATFASGTGIINTEASGTITTAIDYVGNNNAIEAAADGTSITVAATDKLWVSDADDNTIKQINVSQVSGVVDQGLPDVLAINNTTGGTDIAVSANDDITLSNSSKIKWAGTSALEIYDDGSNPIKIETGSARILDVCSDIFQLKAGDGNNNDLMLTHGSEAVEIYYRGNTNPGLRFSTTTTGIEVINTDVNGAPTILLNQDSKNFTITQAVSGAGQIINSFGSLSLKNDGTINLQNKAGTYTKASFDSSISFSPDNLAGTATVPGVTIYQSTDATADGTRTRVYGDLQVDGNIIHEGGNGGIFYGDQSVTSAGGATLAFTLTRATTGTLIFDVWFTSETSKETSVAKKYVVARGTGSGGTPVYNKIIDTGPSLYPNNNNTTDFTVSFIDDPAAATAGTSILCKITVTGTNSSGSALTQNIGYTVQVGHDSTNSLTFTAAS